MTVQNPTAAPTEKQIAFYNTLAAERGLPTIETFADGINRQAASEAIEALKAIKKPGKGTYTGNTTPAPTPVAPATVVTAAPDLGNHAEAVNAAVECFPTDTDEKVIVHASFVFGSKAEAAAFAKHFAALATQINLAIGG